MDRKSDEQNTIAIFFDFKAAYNSVNLPMLYEILEKKDILDK